MEKVNPDGQINEGLRQRKRRKTRAALSRVAIRLSIQRGWENVTVNDIATAANVSPRTFRNYFSTKAEAVAAGHLERMLRIADELRVRPVGEQLWTSLIHSVSAQFEPPAEKAREAPGARRWMERVRFLMSEPAIHGEVLKASAAAQHELAKVIAERTSASLVNDQYSQLMAAVVIAVVGVISERWLREVATRSIVPLMREAFDLVAAGLPEN